MRITRQNLIKIANDTVTQRVRANRNITAAYLCGSVIEKVRDPVLGGTADVDLVFIHDLDFPAEREIIRLTPEVHIDLRHHQSTPYRQARQMRGDHELGPVIYGCKILHDPRHLLDFAQASVRAHFHRADNVLQRARTPLEGARKIWFEYQFDVPEEPGVSDFNAYLNSVEMVANAVAALNGGPLAERWFLLDFPMRAEAAGRPGLYAGLQGLLGAPNIDPAGLTVWLQEWENTITAASETADRPIQLHPHRFLYYQQALQAILVSSDPLAALWPLLTTWTQAASCLPHEHPGYRAWQSALLTLGLLGGGFAERIEALDAYLDAVEELIESWARTQGLKSPFGMR